MKREEKVFQALKNLSKKITYKDLFDKIIVGISAEEIANKTLIPRNVVSHELNVLNRKGRAIKIKSRPVLFIEINHLESIIGEKIENKHLEIKSIDEIIKNYKLKRLENNEVDNDPFRKLIGYNGSLFKQIKLAKSAILYPPNGLNVILTGPTGVGKSYFAQLMYEYAIKVAKIPESAPFVYFNCSEYYNNPELLTGQLFGYKKGSFTGADKDKQGLIMKANNGFLFLDEIHRLPDEGQEKLFTVLDNGKFRRLGDTENEYCVNLRLIGATTSDPNSTFLKTFMRRIPLIIQLPPLSNMSVEERFEMINKFFKDESVKTGLNILIDYNTLYYLMSYECIGNVGQLKNDIKFICAQAYLDVVNNKKDFIELSNIFINNTNINYNVDVERLLNKLRFDNGYYVIESNNNGIQIKDNNEDKNLYEIIEHEFNELRKRKFSNDEIKQIISKKIERYFNIYFKESKACKDGIIPESITDKMSLLIKKISEIVKVKLDDNMINSLYLHIHSLISTAKSEDINEVYAYVDIKNEFPSEYNQAMYIWKLMKDLFGSHIPKSEIIFLTLFINAAANNKIEMKNKNYGLYLIAHGNTTATSIADFINTLLGVNVLKGINMPFNTSVTEVYNILIEQIKMYKFKELLLMVDMGSLTFLGNAIEKKLNVKVFVIQNITTLIALEIAKNALYTNYSIEDICEKVCSEEYTKNIVVKKTYNNDNKDKIIITSCITGIGTAEKIRNLLLDTFKGILPSNIKIVSKDYHSINTIEKFEDSIGINEQVIAIIGTFNINIPDIPFISLEELFSAKGIQKLIKIMDLKNYAKSRDYNKTIEGISKKFIKSITLQSIINYLTILNPEKILSEMEEVLEQICDRLNYNITREKRFRFLIHSCCMVERLLTVKSTFEYKLPDNYQNNKKEICVIKSAFKEIEKTYNINLNDKELFCLYDLLVK